MIDGKKADVNRQLNEFDQRCRTLPEYACYRTEEWIRKNATWNTNKVGKKVMNTAGGQAVV